MKKSLFSLVFLLIFLAACSPYAPVTSDLTDNKTVEKTTEPTTPVQELKGAQPGDLVTVNYVLTFENGTVADTNNEDLAKSSKLRNYQTGEYKFILGQSGKVPGFDAAIRGMELGDHREAVIEPSEPEIIVPFNRTIIQSRLYTIPRLQPFPLGTFQRQFGKPPIIGDIVYNESLKFKYKILNTTERYVIGEIQAKEGEEYYIKKQEWPSQVLRVAKEDIMLIQKPEENQTIDTMFGSAKIFVSKSKIFIRHNPVLGKEFNKTVTLQMGAKIPNTFRVIEVGEDHFIIKRIGLLADKRLKLSVDVIDIVEDVKRVRKIGPTSIVSIDGSVSN